MVYNFKTIRRIKIEESPNGDAQDSKQNQKVKFDETKDQNIRLNFDETKDKKVRFSLMKPKAKTFGQVEERKSRTEFKKDDSGKFKMLKNEIKSP